jgi:hypothetical protein
MNEIRYGPLKCIKLVWILPYKLRCIISIDVVALLAVQSL